jgi:glycogen(starch) synthase
VVEKFGDNYCAIGPYVHKDVKGEFEPLEDLEGPFGQAVAKMRDYGVSVHYGRWLVAGRPRVILLDPNDAMESLKEIKYFIWENHAIGIPEKDELIDGVVAFGHLVKIFLSFLANEMSSKDQLIGQFHEWMGGSSIPDLRKDQVPMKMIFTTHATILGRYLAMNNPTFYNHLPFFEWEEEAKRFGIETLARFERAAAQLCDVFTTVSDVTARECEFLLGRKPDIVLPNGINIKKFDVQHEVQVIHQEYKEEIHQFVMGHFFQSYSFNLDKTLYFFTSGRYEYVNKGFDLTLQSLELLNERMKKANSEMTVVVFFVTNKEVHSINADALETRGVMEEIRQTCDVIIKQVREQLFHSTAANAEYYLPDLNAMVDDYWKLRLRRTIQSWKTDDLPSVITHDLINSENDEILNYLSKSELQNRPEDRVKIVYHPQFISPTNPLFGIEYSQFVRGCHLGIFPSYYEPWGYTPMECIASGVPAITCDLSGFGEFVLRTIPSHENSGLYVVRRSKQTDVVSAEQMAEFFLSFIHSSRRSRITMRNEVERCAENFDWKYLISHYLKAYSMASERTSGMA